MGATRVGIIAEGPTDHALLPALLERIARDRAAFDWPVLGEDAALVLPVRKRGHGGVLDAVRRMVAALRSGAALADYSFFVIVLDRRTNAVQTRVKRLIRGEDRFVLAIAIEEIEAWWLGDRVNTLAFFQLGDELPAGLRYAERGYKAERDSRPKRTLDELTEVSEAVDSRYGVGNARLALDFAEGWRNTARLAAIEGQCPRGFGTFAGAAANALRRAKARASRLS